MTTRMRTHRGITRYLRVYNVLSQAIADGSIGSDGLLPSEPALVRQFRLSRTTIRRALARLEKDGLISRRRGAGTFIRPKGRLRAVSSRAARTLDDPRVLAPGTTVRLLEFGRVPTPEFLRRRWPEFGDAALLIRKTRSHEGRPFVFSTCYVPETRGGRLGHRRLSQRSVLGMLDALDGLSHSGGSGEQTATAVAADAYTARELDSIVGAPLLNVRRLVRDARGRIVQYQDCLYRPDHYELRVVVERARTQTSRPRAGRRT